MEDGRLVGLRHRRSQAAREKKLRQYEIFDDSASFLVQYCKPLHGYGSRNP
jgi:hypothetical protein